MFVLEMPSTAPWASGAVAGVERTDDDQRRHGQDNERVDKHADHRDRALLVRALDIGQRVRMRRGAMPASFENRPRLAPWLMAVLSA